AAHVEDRGDARAEVRAEEPLGMEPEPGLDLFVGMAVAHVHRVGTAVGPSGLTEVDVSVHEAWRHVKTRGVDALRPVPDPTGARRRGGRRLNAPGSGETPPPAGARGARRGRREGSRRGSPSWPWAPPGERRRAWRRRAPPGRVPEPFDAWAPQPARPWTTSAS